MLGDILRNVADALNDDKKTETKSVGDSRAIIRKLEDIPAIYYSNKINETILTHELQQASIFLNGDFIIDYVDDKTYACSYVLYFQDRENNDAYKVAAKSKPLDIQRLTAEAARDLAEHKSIKFAIPELTAEVRKSYKIVRNK